MLNNYKTYRKSWVHLLVHSLTKSVLILAANHSALHSLRILVSHHQKICSAPFVTKVIGVNLEE